MQFSKDTLDLFVQLLSAVQVNPMQEGADAGYQRLRRAREELLAAQAEPDEIVPTAPVLKVVED